MTDVNHNGAISVTHHFLGAAKLDDIPNFKGLAKMLCGMEPA